MVDKTNTFLLIQVSISVIENQLVNHLYLKDELQNPNPTLSNDIPTNNQITDKIQQWIIEEDDIWNFQKISQDEVFLNIQLQSLNERNIHILMDAIHDRVLLTATMNPTEQQRKALSLQLVEEKKRFRANLLLMLYQMGINVSVSGKQEDKIEEIKMENVVYFDGLTKDRLFDLVFLILRGIESIQEFFNTLPTIPDDTDLFK